MNAAYGGVMSGAVRCQTFSCDILAEVKTHGIQNVYHSAPHPNPSLPRGEGSFSSLRLRRLGGKNKFWLDALREEFLHDRAFGQG